MAEAGRDPKSSYLTADLGRQRMHQETGDQLKGDNDEAGYDFYTIMLLRCGRSIGTERKR